MADTQWNIEHLLATAVAYMRDVGMPNEADAIIELQRRAATQPADAALADDVRELVAYIDRQFTSAVHYKIRQSEWEKVTAALRARPQAVAEAVPQCFVEYMAKNYPPNTLIADGAWHARPIWNAARSAMLAASQSATGGAT